MVQRAWSVVQKHSQGSLGLTCWVEVPVTANPMQIGFIQNAALTQLQLELCLLLPVKSNNALSTLGNILVSASFPISHLDS